MTRDIYDEAKLLMKSSSIIFICGQFCVTFTFRRALVANISLSISKNLTKDSNIHVLLLLFSDVKSDETPPSSPTLPSPPISPKIEQPPPIPVPPESTSDDMETAGDEAEEETGEEAVFSDEEAEHEKEATVSKSKFKPIVKDDEESGKVEDGLNGVDVIELDEFQNIDNTLLRDNILKLKNDR